MHRAAAGLVAALVLAGSPAPARADAPVLTHTSPLTPTGELAPRGHIVHTQSVAAFYHELGLGLTDQLELRLGSPGLPVPILGGDLQLRASVLAPTSRLRVLIGTGVAAEWINGGDLWLGVSATAAYRADRWSVHATARALDHRFETGDRIGLATAGVTVEVGRRTTLFAEVGNLSWLRPATCQGKHDTAVPCPERDTVHGAMVGSWWRLHDMSIGLSALIGWQGSTVVPILPLLSLSWDRDFN